MKIVLNKEHGLSQNQFGGRMFGGCNADSAREHRRSVSKNEGPEGLFQKQNLDVREGQRAEINADDSCRFS